MSWPGRFPCGICGEPVDPTDPSIFRRVVGWERKAGTRVSGKHGGSDISLRELRDEYAHAACVKGAKAGVVPGQAAMT